MSLAEPLEFKTGIAGSMIWQFLLLFSVISFGFLTLHAQTDLKPLSESKQIVINEVQDAEIFAFGKTVIIKKEVKGVLVFGGDVIIEGRVEGDVATIGGSVIQKEDAFIGGDVIVFGGKYQHEKSDPLRDPEKETIMYAGYEEELRELTLNPSHLFAPQVSWSYFVQRILSVLFWFIVSLIFTTIAPGAVSRAVSRFQLSTLKIVGIGLSVLITTTIAVVAGLSFLPTNIGGIIGLMAFLIILLAYFYGRVSLQVFFGKVIQKKFIPERFHAEATSLFIGSVAWTLLLSLPYVWTLGVVLLFSTSLGLVLTSNSTKNWQVS